MRCAAPGCWSLPTAGTGTRGKAGATWPGCQGRASAPVRRRRFADRCDHVAFPAGPRFVIRLACRGRPVVQAVTACRVMRLAAGRALPDVAASPASGARRLPRVRAAGRRRATDQAVNLPAAGYAVKGATEDAARRARPGPRGGLARPGPSAGTPRAAAARNPGRHAAPPRISPRTASTSTCRCSSPAGTRS